ncbi:MAG: hypothetical protein ACE5FD_03090 [Anaerolineae bacterium]
MSLWDQLESLDQDKQAKKEQTEKKRGKRDALEQTTSADARKAVGASMRGKYWSRTMRLPPEFEALFKDVATEEGFGSLADAERWVVAMGFHAYYELGMRPEFEKAITRTVILPEFNR